MRSPADFAATLAQQWNNADLREARLLDADSWPLCLPIAKPAPKEIAEQPAAVRVHLAQWRSVTIGSVAWRSERYRDIAEPLEIPVQWRLDTPSQWIAAIGDATVHLEFGRLERFVEQADARFYRLLIRRRALWRDRSDDQVFDAMRLAGELSPGCAAGKPLRALSLAGIDSKFIEHHRPLLVALLDARFDDQVSEFGLEGFLGAKDEGSHWLLLAPLDSGLLAFEQQRIRAAELERASLPGSRVLIIENEQCLYALPKLRDTVAILGAGLNLGWLGGAGWGDKRIGYWGDLDTWGLTMLACARIRQPHIESLLMHRELFDRFSPTSAVVEPVPAGSTPPAGLTPAEAALYCHLRALEKGRLEQEFLPADQIAAELALWLRDAELA